MLTERKFKLPKEGQCVLFSLPNFGDHQGSFEIQIFLQMFKCFNLSPPFSLTLLQYAIKFAILGNQQP